MAQDYLESRLDKLLPEGPLTVIQTCLDYLIKVSDICSAAENGWDPSRLRRWAARWPLAKDALIILKDHEEDRHSREPFQSTLTGRAFIAFQIAVDAFELKFVDVGLKCFREKYVFSSSPYDNVRPDSEKDPIP